MLILGSVGPGHGDGCPGCGRPLPQLGYPTYAPPVREAGSVSQRPRLRGPTGVGVPCLVVCPPDPGKGGDLPNGLCSSCACGRGSGLRGVSGLPWHLISIPLPPAHPTEPRKHIVAWATTDWWPAVQPSHPAARSLGPPRVPSPHIPSLLLETSKPVAYVLAELFDHSHITNGQHSPCHLVCQLASLAHATPRRNDTP